MKNRLKSILAFLGLAILAIIVNLIPELVGGDIADALKKIFGGIYFYVIGGIGIATILAYTYWTESNGIFISKSKTSTPEKVSQDNLQKIRNSLLESYQKRINSKLASRFPINLEVTYTREGSPTKGHLYNKSLRISDLKKELIEIFDKQHGRLLIIGAPGAGKTTLLLQLAIKLIERGEEQIPFIINIATWRPRFNSIEDWLEELLPQLGFSKALALQIIKEQRLLPLFDGLDELKEEERARFMDAVASYGKGNTTKYVICSRIAEYSATKDAAVEGQVVVKPLSLSQIKQGLKETPSQETNGLLDALYQNMLLAEALKTPFYLNTARLLFSQKETWQELGFVGDDLERREEEIVEKFVNNSVDNFNNLSREEVQKWLAFIAHRMGHKNIVHIELSSLQYHWCKLNRIQLIAQGIAGGFVRGLMLGIVRGLVIGITGCVLLKDRVFGLIAGLAIGLGIGMIDGLGEGLTKSFKMKILEIETREQSKWTFYLLIKGIKRNLSLGLSVGLSFGVFLGLVAGLVEGGLLGYLLIFIYYGTAWGFIIGLVGGLIIGLLNMLQNSQSYLKINHPYQRFYASMWSLHFSILQHFHLRWILYEKGLLPWRLVDFLNDATENNILESDGGSWRFRHRILQDYFAEHWEQEYAATEDGMMEEEE